LKGTGSGSLKEEKRRHLSLISWTQCNKFATTGTYMTQTGVEDTDPEEPDPLDPYAFVTPGSASGSGIYKY
jgi:hypothetical protein